MQPLEFLTKIETFVKTNPEKFDFFGLVKLQNPEHPQWENYDVVVSASWLPKRELKAIEFMVRALYDILTLDERMRQRTK